LFQTQRPVSNSSSARLDKNRSFLDVEQEEGISVSERVNLIGTKVVQNKPVGDVVEKGKVKAAQEALLAARSSSSTPQVKKKDVGLGVEAGRVKKAVAAASSRSPPAPPPPRPSPAGSNNEKN
jgi:hypothetical protein